MHFSPTTIGMTSTVLVGVALVALVGTSGNQGHFQHPQTGTKRATNGALMKTDDDAKEPSRVRQRGPRRDDVSVQVGMDHDLAKKTLLAMGAIDKSKSFSDEPERRMILTEKTFPVFVAGLGDGGKGLTLAEMNQKLAARADELDLPRFAEIGFWKLDSDHMVRIYSRGEIENQLVITSMSVFPAGLADDKLRIREISKSFTRLWWLDGHAAWE